MSVYPRLPPVAYPAGSPAPALPPGQRSRSWEHVKMVAVLGLPLGLLVIAAAGLSQYLHNDWDEANAAAERELASAMAQADQLDSGWQFEDLMAGRKEIPDEKNGAIVVSTAAALRAPPLPPQMARTHPDDFHSRDLEEALKDTSPNQRLSQLPNTWLHYICEKNSDALAEARNLADLPQGRYSIHYEPDYRSTKIPCIQDAREVAQLLKLDALLHAEEGEPDQALVSVRAVLNTGRSIGDEPGMICQFVRIGCRISAIIALERALAQGEPSDQALAAVQQILAEEDSFPALLVAARGERAGIHKFMEALESGEVDPKQFLRQQANPQARELVRGALAVDPPTLKSAHAWMLVWLTESVEIAKLPPWQRLSRLTQLGQKLRPDADPPPLARLLLPAMDRLAEADQRSQALLRSALVAVTAERYRRDSGLWPLSLAVRQALRVYNPLDPFDGQPLHHRVLPDGLVIYSVGLDGNDDNGNLERKPDAPFGLDIGFRLWNPEHRRQSPAAKRQP